MKTSVQYIFVYGIGRRFKRVVVIFLASIKDSTDYIS
jgi:hypothetical protein